jgi:hypothetical protein
MRKPLSILLPVYFIYFLNSTFAQAPTILWQKCFGSNGNEYANSGEQTNDGGYIMAGKTQVNTSSGDVSGLRGYIDYWVMKTDSAGTLQWQKCLGGSLDDQAHSIRQTTDGSYVVAGFTNSNDSDVTGNHGNNWDFWIVKLDSAGNMQWQKCHGGTGEDRAYSIEQTKDGGYVVAGRAGSSDGEVTGAHGLWDMWVIKLDTAGNLQWENALGGSGGDGAYSVAETFDGGYILAGYASGNDGDVSGNHGSGFDCWIVKLDSVGTLKWQKCFGGTTTDYAYSIRETSDSGFIFVGDPTSTNGDVTGHYGNSDYWLVKLDSIGNLQWQKCLGGTDADIPYSVKQTNDNEYVIAGRSRSIDYDVTGGHGYEDYWIVKTNSTGNIEWQQCYGGSGAEEAHYIQATTDGGFFIAGSTHSYDGDVTGNHGTSNEDFWLVKLNPAAPLNVEEGIS